MSAVTVFSPDARKNRLGWMNPKTINEHIALVMKYLADKGDKAPAPEDIFTNEFVGSIKIADNEWDKVAGSYDKYKGYLG